ncbi:metallophosphoesterase [Aureibacter tunicatorum]|uniref:Calcineurin-like phosphoesterase domain-containing protein n=1 Tax=Aureibacter tunicatorum TaxID=866807 RepID=A0AAE3XS18_9BACT|nr:metallophosphoesterase [Aureibacter tunicatorum]MDR6241505.1 hypothetical protein [Aureibacter tunicatorum]
MHHKIIAWGAILMIILSSIIPMRIRNFDLSTELQGIISQSIYILLGFMSYLFLLLLAKDVIRVLMIAMEKAKGQTFVGLSSANIGGIGIRKAVNSVLIIGAFGLTLYGYRQAVKVPPFKYIDVKIDNLPIELEGVTIAQLTDLHIAYPCQTDWLRDVVEKVNSANPDLVVITGDVADQKASRIEKEIGSLANIKAKYGKYFVTGNHEYYHDHEGWIQKMEELDFTVLMNDYDIVEHKSKSIIVAGVPDYEQSAKHDQYSDPEMAMEGAPSADVKILLAHQPQNIYEASMAGYDLQLSGHTHGGQFFPWNLIIGMAQEFLHGLHTYQNTQLYVSRGTGYWGPPIRLSAPSEITLIRLSKSNGING